MRGRNFDKNDSILTRDVPALLVTATSQTDKVFLARKIRHPFKVLGADLYASGVTAAVAVSGTVVPQGTGLLTAAVLAIDAVPEKFKITTAFKALLAGKVVEKATATAIAFSAAHVISADTFGVVLVQMDNAGAVSTKVPLATQAYTSAAQALAALPAADSGKIAIGRIAIAAGSADWTAQTDDLTDASDVETATFAANSALAKFMTAQNHVALTAVEATVTDTNGNNGDYVVLWYTTDGTGALVNGRVVVRYRIRGGLGEVV